MEGPRIVRSGFSFALHRRTGLDYSQHQLGKRSEGRVEGVPTCRVAHGVRI
jgi:hypothetical protein